ncbi:oligopeptide transport ATP-binding protein [Coxiella burnetii CbuK_Q154]|nr:oligopeptide transport ATP-binding protein [Coxiella burnetii CbuK_Q154]ATN85121.1 peptide ABC transporter ATP-binding protein [Coxiella burnetii str. Schperling]EAX33905.1 peptide ABC transporter ATP-binding protein [Coxiella burnetii 'MSU Goat Q177']
MPKPLIEINHLTVAFGRNAKPAISQLSVSLQRGQCLALVGESGSGKSMTALAVMQLLPLTAQVSDRSQILWEGKNLLRFSERTMRQIRGFKISMIFQDAISALNPVLTIQQQMNEILKKKYRHIQSRALQLLEEVGIKNSARVYHSYPHQLSGGMRQRAMIAMALAGEPEMIIADEPTTALDVTIQAQVLSLLNRLKNERNITLLFISHDLGVVSQLADEIAVLKAGRVVEHESRDQFFQQPKEDYSRRLLAAIPTLETKRDTKTKATALLEAKALKIYFPVKKGIFRRKVADIKAVDGISFKVPAGKTLALVGESGSGKTTTAKAIVRLIAITEGRIQFQSKNLVALSEWKMKRVRKDIQMIFQDPYTSLNPRRMIADSLSEAMSAQKIIRKRQAQLNYMDELLKQVGLSPDYKWRYPHEFSGGERQRICIARALALKPKLLILDEPTSALDVSIQMQILKLLEKIQKEHNIAYLLITHNLGIVAYLAHEVAVMKEGKIVEQGPTQLLLKDPSHSYTKNYWIPFLKLRGRIKTFVSGRKIGERRPS